MKILVAENLRKIKKAVPFVESKIKIKIGFSGNRIIIKGEEVNEYLADKILRAVDFGFEIEDALLLKNSDYILEFIDIKGHTRRKNLKDVRARLIGTKGKAKNAIQELTGAIIVISDNQVGVIVGSDHLDAVIQGIILLVQGSKHGNVFSYLEKQNAEMRKYDSDDLGLKGKFGEYVEE